MNNLKNGASANKHLMLNDAIIVDKEIIINTYDFL